MLIPREGEDSFLRGEGEGLIIPVARYVDRQTVLVAVGKADRGWRGIVALDKCGPRGRGHAQDRGDLPQANLGCDITALEDSRLSRGAFRSSGTNWIMPSSMGLPSSVTSPSSLAEGKLAPPPEPNGTQLPERPARVAIQRNANDRWTRRRNIETPSKHSEVSASSGGMRISGQLLIRAGCMRHRHVLI
jgi:hypothetical protein